MKRGTRLLLIIGTMVLCAAAVAQERITQFDSDIRIDPNGDLTVTETITVMVQGQQIKRGLLREFPTDYVSRVGQRVRVPFRLLSVTRNGQAEPWREERLTNGVRIRMGQEQVLLPHGQHQYVLVYSTARQLGFFDRYDELYWNVTGNDWRLPIERVSARVQLPQSIMADQLQAEAYTGLMNEQGRDYQSQWEANGASYVSTRTLQPGEGLTLVLSFPKGLVTEPTWQQRFLDWWQVNPGSIWGGASVFLGFFWLLWRWWRVGRDPRPGPLFPRYEAPPGLGPAGVGYVDTMGLDNRIFAAALLGLAERGVLRLHQHHDHYVLEATGKTPEWWWPGEKPLFRTLFAGQEKKTLSTIYDPTLQQAMAESAKHLQRQLQAPNFKRNGAAFLVVGVLAVAGVIGMVYWKTPGLTIFIVVALLVGLFVIFSKIMPAYTPGGRQLKDAIEGLKLYLGTAEKEDLARMQTPPVTAAEFSKFLPYALALGVEKTWADRFTLVLGSAAVSAAVAHYYTSDQGISGGSGSINSLTDSLGQLGDTVSAASTPPGSESGSSGGSSSGGGSSGGGGGGGGGGGW